MSEIFYAGLRFGQYAYTMISAISTSLSGLQSASRRLNLAAEKSVGINSGGQKPVAISPLKNGKTGRPNRVNFQAEPDLISAAVDLKFAEISYKASAKVLKVALELEGVFIDETK